MAQQTTAATAPATWVDLRGKVALVTGAARGIGQAIAATLAAAGAKVVATDVDAQGIRDSAAANGCQGVVLNVADEAAVDACIDAVVAQHGGLDILVNTAGVYLGFGGPIADMKTETWRGLMAVNLDGVFYCCRAGARAMIRRGCGGRIVNVASTQAVTPGVGVSYDSSKAAVVQMTRTLALELAQYRINVNAVAPGATWVQSDQPAPALEPGKLNYVGEPLTDQVMDRIRRIPLGHWGEPQDVAKATLFLASPMSDFITGIYLPVDGGWLVL
jgi:NAD(P)-dependent dehydrogenase (short-subunit alcohol dehydrogenase family)